jgi:hypothetical protein
MPRKSLWLGLVLALAAGGASADASLSPACEKTKADIQKQGEACTAESAEAARIGCATKEDLTAVIKLFRRCGDKKVAAATGSKRGGASGAKARSADSAAGKTAAERKCKAVDPADSKDIAEASAAKITECTVALKDKVKAARCAAGTEKVEYLSQTEFAGKWSKGVKISLACK